MSRSDKNSELLLWLLLVCCFFSLSVLPACAGEDEPSWQFAVKQKTLFNSHTSYEFGNPLHPYQKPLSRLEFPVDSIWGGFEARKNLSRFSAGLEFLTSLADQEAGRFKDSDWEDEEMPGRLTTYSESSCRLAPSYQVRADIDMQVADLLNLPKGFDLRPVIGFRWQQFSLVAHDGTQYSYETPGLPPLIDLLPGDSITFEQNWYQYFLGMRLGYEWQRLSWLHRLKLQTQLDWSYVYGENRDHHLLRIGTRITEEQTSGDAWHASLGVLFGITKNLDMGVEADYLKIQTTGTHTLRNFDVVSWTGGVKAWSEQYGVSVKLGYRF